MIKPWTRDDTRFWISQLEHRLEDIDYYLKETIEWCENNDIYDDRQVFILSFLTVIWVSHMRDEPISYVELLEILGIPEMVTGEDKIYELCPEFLNITHEELLKIIHKDLDNNGNYFPS